MFELKMLDYLKDLKPDEVYSFFHENQFQALSPQWNKRLKSLLPEVPLSNVKEIRGSRTPEVPKTFSNDVRKLVSTSDYKTVIFFNCSLSRVKDPCEILDLAQSMTLSSIVIHDAPHNGSLEYVSKPEVSFFTERNKNVQNKEIDSSKIDSFDQAIDWSESHGWQVTNDDLLDFIYSSKADKMALIKMELALDLIYHHFVGAPTNFDALKSELETWFSHPEATLRIKGCSRWLKIVK